jgi:hypothetical protein
MDLFMQEEIWGSHVSGEDADCGLLGYDHM